ncbi:MAG: C-terminal binding protein [Spirochaetes bacterium]|nr:C-terminal binding protein [Spirochaetota bacterium]
MASFKVFVAEQSYPDYEEEMRIVEANGGALYFAHCESERDIVEQCAGANAVLLRQTPMGEHAFRSLPGLMAVCRYGAGCDNVDISQATKYGVVVTSVPDYCTGEVADHAIALLLSLIRRVPLRDRLVRRGEWDLGPRYPVFRTAGKTFGLVGYGRTAREVRKRLSGFGFHFFACDPYVKKQVFDADGTTPLDFKKLAIVCDYLSIHVPLSERTHHLFNLSTFRMMKKDAILVNTSRGAVIDQRALYTALKEELIGGAALDVYESEPFDTKSPLCGLDNVVLSDHAAWYSEESRRELQRRTAQEAVHILKGGVVEHAVNPEVLSQKIVELKQREQSQKPTELLYGLRG